MTEQQLGDWRAKALALENLLGQAIIGQPTVIRQLLIAIFARGHVLLEGSVGTGKTTLLRAAAQGLGGAYQRVEGSIDLLPADLIYYTYLDGNGKPRVEEGPLLKQGERLAVFFFNEINRARPQVHAFLLRAMAEQQVSAFNQDFPLPHLQVFADRNRVEREETFELPAAAKDRFMFEIHVATPEDDAVLEQLMFSDKFHDTGALVLSLTHGLIEYYELNRLAAAVQQSIQSTPRLGQYALLLWKATHKPQDYGIRLPDTDMVALMLAGASPRAMSQFIRAAKIHAWLQGRSSLLPEDLQAVFALTVQHRIFLDSQYAYRQDELLPALISGILNHIAAP